MFIFYVPNNKKYVAEAPSCSLLVTLQLGWMAFCAVTLALIVCSRDCQQHVICFVRCSSMCV